MGLNSRLKKLARADPDAVRAALSRLPDGADKPERHKVQPFADMGYLPDGLKRFPLTSQDEAWAAWRHLKQRKNALVYSRPQLKRIFGRIADALRRFGMPADAAERWSRQEIEAAIEARRIELEEYRRLSLAPASGDKRVRQRTGRDDHLELGEYKRAKPRRVPPSPVARRTRSTDDAA